MGRQDQFIKDVFAEETPRLTQNGARFSVPPEIKTSELHADGLLSVERHEALRALAAPWSLIEGGEVLLEFKMQGDKTGRYEVERALLRRQAWQAQRAKSQPNDAAQIPLWMISANLPDWLRHERLLLPEATGCYRLEPAFSRFYFIAANELPLQPELLPFLVSRSGSALVDFGKWLLHQDSAKWLELVLEVIPMSDAQFEDIASEIPQPSQEIALRRKRIFAQLLAQHTGLADDLVEQGREEGRHAGREEETRASLLRRYKKRLGRPLAEPEQAALLAKLAALGQERLDDALFELEPAALAAWLLDPSSR